MEVDSRLTEDHMPSSVGPSNSAGGNGETANAIVPEPRTSSSILASPAKFEALIKFGRSLQELAQQVNQYYTFAPVSHLLTIVESLGAPHYPSHTC